MLHGLIKPKHMFRQYFDVLLELITPMVKLIVIFRLGQ